MKQHLIGHSGCDLELIETHEQSFVRKTSPHVDYNQRLHDQYLKQSQVSIKNFIQTKVYDSGVDAKGLFYFDMEHIPGNNLAQSVSELKKTELESLAEIFSHLYKTEASYHSPKIFHDKIASLKEQISPTQRSLLKTIFDSLDSYNWFIEKSETCHGDLGLENILLNDNKLYIIDLLDSFSNSWVIDIAKVLQDTEMKWAFRNQDMGLELSEKLDYLSSRLMSKLILKGLTLKQYKDCYYILTLNMIRILPYSRTPETEQFLISKIAELAFKLQTLEIDYEYLNRSLRR